METEVEDLETRATEDVMALECAAGATFEDEEEEEEAPLELGREPAEATAVAADWSRFKMQLRQKL